MKKLNLNTIITKLKNRIFTQEETSVFPLKKGASVILALGIAAFMIQFRNKAPEPIKERSVTNLDIFIPEGQSLVPIQVNNYESLDQIIGQFGVVDLLSTPLNPGEKAKRIAYAVKLIRSPKSRRYFSVLLPASEAHKLAGYHGEFTVVVRNPKLLGTKVVNRRKRTVRRSVLFETE